VRDELIDAMGPKGKDAEQILRLAHVTVANGLTVDAVDFQVVTFEGQRVVASVVLYEDHRRLI